MKMNLLWCCFITVMICVECGPITEYIKENKIYNNDGAGSTDDVKEQFQKFGLKEIDTNIESFEKIPSFVKTNNDEEKNYYIAKGITPDDAIQIIPITLEEVNTMNSMDAENYGTDEKRTIFFQFKQKHNKEDEGGIIDSNNNDNNGVDSSRSFVQTAVTHTDNENILAEEISYSTIQTVANTQVIEILEEESGNSSGSGGGVDLGAFDNDAIIFIDDADVYIITKTFSTTTAKYDEFPDDFNNTTLISDDYLAKDVLIDDNGFGSGNSSGEPDDDDDNLNKNKETDLHELIPEEEIIIEGSGMGPGSGAGSGEGKISHHGNAETFIDDEDLYTKMKRVSSTPVNLSSSTIYDHSASGSGDNPYLDNVDENSSSGSGSEESSGDGDVDEKERNYLPTTNQMLSSVKSVESVRSTTSNGNADFYYLNYDDHQDLYL